MIETTIHATAIAIGEAGILIRGPANSGKTELAAALLAEAGRHGHVARLVADDRVGVAAIDGQLVLGAPVAIAGRLSLRGVGIVAVDFQARATAKLIVDLTAPEEICDKPPQPSFDKPGKARVEGISLRRVILPPRAADATAIRTVLAFLSEG